MAKKALITGQDGSYLAEHRLGLGYEERHFELRIARLRKWALLNCWIARLRDCGRALRVPASDFCFLLFAFRGTKEVPTGTCHAILKAAGLTEGR